MTEDAVQFTGDVREIRAWVAERVDVSVEQGAVVLTLPGWDRVTAGIGDWLVFTPPRTWRVYEPADFERHYERL